MPAIPIPLRVFLKCGQCILKTPKKNLKKSRRAADELAKRIKYPRAEMPISLQNEGFMSRCVL